VGLSPDQSSGDPSSTSFLVLADPKFQQTRPLLAGLDFAFPSATKVGGVISSGQRYKRRAMYAWSADAPVQPGSQQRRKKQQGQRLQQQTGSAGTSSASQQQQQEERFGQDNQRQEQQQQEQQQGFLGSLFSKIKSSFTDEPPSSSNTSSNTSSSSKRAAVFKQAEGDEDDDWAHDTGMHMYGAAVLALRGNIYFDPITSQVGGWLERVIYWDESRHCSDHF